MSSNTLLNLLKGDKITIGGDQYDNNLYTTNIGSKGLGYSNGTSGVFSSPPLLGGLVSWDNNNVKLNIVGGKLQPGSLASPTFADYSNNEGYQKGSTIDAFVRGGVKFNENRRGIDKKRISAFFDTNQGKQFIAKQVALQALNKRKPNLYNLGINTLQSVALSGISNVKRGGLLSLGGIDLIETLGLGPTNYLDDMGGPLKTNLRENKYKLGDPGNTTAKQGLKELIKSINPLTREDVNYNTKYYQKIDKLNALPIITRTPNTVQSYDSKFKDFVNFNFEIVDHDGMGNNIIAFRAYLEGLSDDYSATHNEYKYNGRGESFYTYNKFNRKIQISFKIAAQSRWEMKPLYQKLNYLAAQTAPNYSDGGRIRTPYCYLTVGDWFGRLPGLISSVGLTWQKDYIWEIAADPDDKDKDMLVLPHVLDVSLSFQPIHSFTPSNNVDSPFISIDGGAAKGVKPNWLSNMYWPNYVTENEAINGVIANPQTDTNNSDFTGEEIEPWDSGQNTWKASRNRTKSKANQFFNKIGDGLGLKSK